MIRFAKIRTMDEYKYDHLVKETLINLNIQKDKAIENYSKETVLLLEQVKSLTDVNLRLTLEINNLKQFLPKS